MKKLILQIFWVFIIIQPSFNLLAQKDRMKHVVEDVFTEMEQGLFTLRFFDALTGNPVEGASVAIENVGEYITDSAGRVLFPKQPDGVYRVIFEKPRYIKSLYRIEVIAETIFKNRLVVSPAMNIDQFRVVLDWDEKPADLDAHFIKKNSYHISYRNTRVLSDGTGQLDRDDTDGYGPETITVASLDANSEYIFLVNNYSAKTTPDALPLAKSKATVRVYGNNRLLKTFQVPQNHNGIDWYVFKVVNGQIEPY